MFKLRRRARLPPGMTTANVPPVSLEAEPGGNEGSNRSPPPTLGELRAHVGAALEAIMPSYRAGDLARLKARDPQRWQAIQCAEEAMARAAALVLKGEMTSLAWVERVEAWRGAWMSGLKALHQAAAQPSVRPSSQRVWYDFDVPDGAYTPEMLREARKVAKPWGHHTV
jgi:hypothetical protein